MKKFKNYLLWAMLSIMLQCSVVLYLDKVHFRQSSDFVLTEVKPEESKLNVSVPLPESAENIQVSYDGKYATYNINEKFYLLNISSEESTEIITNDGEKEILCSNWLQDRNGIVIAEKKRNDSGKNVIGIMNYNVQTNLSVEVKEICSYSKGMKVNNISSSISSGVTYVSISSKGKSSTIYRFDIEHKIDTVASQIENLGFMNVFPDKDVLIYSDEGSGQSYSYNGTLKKVNLGGTKDFKLLSLVDKDKMFIGKLENGKVKEILRGTLYTDISTWNQEKLEKPVDIQDIYINKDSEVIINDKVEGKVINLTTSKTTEYNGKLISINNKVLCSIDSGKLCVKKLVK